MVSSAHCTAVRIELLTRRGRASHGSNAVAESLATVAAQAVELATRSRRGSGRGRRELRRGLVGHRAHGRARVGRAAARPRPCRYRLSRRAQGQREHDGFLGRAVSRTPFARRSASAASRRPTSTPALPMPTSWRSIRRISICISLGISTSSTRRALALRAENAARGFDPRIANSEGASVSTGSGHRVYANSHGFVGGYPTSTYSTSCSVVAKSNGSLERDYWYTVSRAPDELESPEQRRRGSGAPRGAAARRAAAVDARGARAVSGRDREGAVRPSRRARFAARPVSARVVSARRGRQAGVAGVHRHRRGSADSARARERAVRRAKASRRGRVSSSPAACCRATCCRATRRGGSGCRPPPTPAACTICSCKPTAGPLATLIARHATRASSSASCSAKA